MEMKTYSYCYVCLKSVHHAVYVYVDLWDAEKGETKRTPGIDGDGEVGGWLLCNGNELHGTWMTMSGLCRGMDDAFCVTRVCFGVALFI